jgi:iron complex outermembrane receptor protein
LYYSGGGGFGNPDLKPESSYQAEIGNVFTYKKITLSQTAYFIKIEDLISWQPASNSNWSPVNAKKVNTYGLESSLNYKNNFNKHYFNINATYGYTVSRNLETNNQLAYVPFHKATASLGYSYAKFSINYQFLYNGFVYILADNLPNQIVKGYRISNIGLDYDFKFLKSFKLGIQVANIFNYKYQSVEGRYMPGRNFNIFTNFKF